MFPIPLPPLRDRGEDIVLLAVHFLDELNQSSGTAKRLSASARERLMRYGWPGNVRELRNVVQRDHIMGGDELGMDALLAVVADSGVPSAVRADGIGVGMPLVEVERRMILATLEHCGGDKKQAAQVLGISLKTLYNRLNVYAGRSEA